MHAYQIERELESDARDDDGNLVRRAMISFRAGEKRAPPEFRVSWILTLSESRINTEERELVRKTSPHLSRRSLTAA
jgi:hypothetical protein